MLGYPPIHPGEPGGRPPDPPTPNVWVNQRGGGGPSPSLQPPKLSHTPRGHTLAGGGPRAFSSDLCIALHMSTHSF